MADTGLILKGVGGFYTVLSDNGTEIVCRARGRFRKDGITPVVGDRVEYVEDGEGRSVSKILPRRNIFIRPAVANLDKLIIVASLSAPKPDLMLMDKLIIRCEKHNVEPVIVLNKCDQADADAAEDIRAQYAPAGYTIITASAAKGDGVDAIKAEIAGNICCFAGQSAVGKSSLINAIVPELALETGGLSRKTDRGRHTTRHAQLWHVCGGASVFQLLLRYRAAFAVGFRADSGSFGFGGALLLLARRFGFYYSVKYLFNHKRSPRNFPTCGLSAKKPLRYLFFPFYIFLQILSSKNNRRKKQKKLPSASACRALLRRHRGKGNSFLIVSRFF